MVLPNTKVLKDTLSDLLDGRVQVDIAHGTKNSFPTIVIHYPLKYINKTIAITEKTKEWIRTEKYIFINVSNKQSTDMELTFEYNTENIDGVILYPESNVKDLDKKRDETENEEDMTIFSTVSVFFEMLWKLILRICYIFGYIFGFLYRLHKYVQIIVVLVGIGMLLFGGGYLYTPTSATEDKSIHVTNQTIGRRIVERIYKYYGWNITDASTNTTTTESMHSPTPQEHELPPDRDKLNL